MVAEKRLDIVLLTTLAFLLLFPGCNAFGLRKQLQQLEDENGRLLSEFRAERQRRETAEKTAQHLELRLAESEKRLARRLQDDYPGRISSLPSLNALEGLPGQSGSPQFGGSSLGSGNGFTNQNNASGELRWKQRPTK